MTRRRRLALAAGAALAGAAAAGPLLDGLVGRVEDRMNPVGPPPATPVSERAAALHATLRVADLHADSLLWGRDLLARGSRGAVDVPRLIEGNVALQVFSMAVKTPRGLNIERNDDSSDQVLPLALAKRWPPATWGRLLPRVQHLAHEEVAPPEQRVGVEVGDPERGVERRRTGRDRRPGRRGHRVHPVLDAGDDPVEHGTRHGRAGQRGAGRDRETTTPGHAPNARPRVGRIRIGTL